MSDDKALERKVLDAVSAAIEGSEWAPPEGGILVDALVVMIHIDNEGNHGTSWISQGSSEQADGMAAYVRRAIDAKERLRLTHMIMGVHDEDDKG